MANTQNAYRVLYIDDNEQAGRLMTIYLHRAGFDVDLVNSASEARERLKETGIHAIIIDIGLPGESGVEFYKWLQSAESYKNIPALLVSAHAFGFDGFMAEHRDIFFSKPIFFPDLISRLKKMLNQ